MIFFVFIFYVFYFCRQISWLTKKIETATFHSERFNGVIKGNLKGEICCGGHLVVTCGGELLFYIFIFFYSLIYPGYSKQSHMWITTQNQLSMPRHSTFNYKWNCLLNVYYSGIFYSCQFIKSFRSLHSF